MSDSCRIYVNVLTTNWGIPVTYRKIKKAQVTHNYKNTRTTKFI